jgi:hypothetical protein
MYSHAPSVMIVWAYIFQACASYALVTFRIRTWSMRNYLVVCHTTLNHVDTHRHPCHAIPACGTVGVYFNMSFPLMVAQKHTIQKEKKKKNEMHSDHSAMIYCTFSTLASDPSVRDL